MCSGPPSRPCGELSRWVSTRREQAACFERLDDELALSPQHRQVLRRRLLPVALAQRPENGRGPLPLDVDRAVDLLEEVAGDQTGRRAQYDLDARRARRFDDG